MVQRKVPTSKLGIQADYHQISHDGKTRGGGGGTDIMKKTKKMKKSKPIKLSDMEILKSSSSSSKKPPNSNVSSFSPIKLTPLNRTSDGSPNYMKPTSSSDAKKELFPVSLRNSNKPNNSSKSCSVSAKKPAKTLTKSSSPSLKLVRTLTKAPSFKKSSRVSLCADMNPQRATCSSTLKDSKFPPYLMLNPGATESEGTSVMTVCPYTYCSLNGDRHASLPPLKTFMSARRRILKTQKSIKQEALSPRKMKLPCEPEKKESGPDMDFFIEIYASKKNEEEEEIKPTTEDEKNFVTQGDYYDDMKQVVASLSDGSPKSEIDSEEDYGKYFDDAKIEADSKGFFVQEQEAEFADSDGEMSTGSYKGEILGGSDSEATDMEWEHEEEGNDDDDSSILIDENDSKVESPSESSHDVSVMWLDDIIDIYYEDIVAEVSQESKKAMEGTNEDGGENDGTTVESSNSTEETFEELEETGEQNQDDNNDVSEAENSMNKELLDLEDNDKADYMDKIHNDTLDDDQEDTSPQQEDSSMSQASQISESLVAAETDNNKMEEEGHADLKEELVGNRVSDDKVSEEKKNSRKYVNEENKLESSSDNNWKGFGRGKRAVREEEEDEMRKFNPREPNFLPLVPDPEAEKVDLKHQMMDERKNAEEWMVDYALRQTVTKLAPARKRKVALLVEAFESVTPIHKFESHRRNKSTFSNPRPIQACR